MAFVASEEDDDEEEKPEAEVDFNHDDVGKRIELIPNRDILIHKPQVRFEEKLWQYGTNCNVDMLEFVPKSSCHPALSFGRRSPRRRSSPPRGWSPAVRRT